MMVWSSSVKRKPIALIKETRQSQFVKKIMDAIAPELTLKSTDKVGIKIDLSGSKEIYANTHYETVESLIQYLKSDIGVTDISVMEGSEGAYFSSKTTWDVFYKFRYKEVELKGVRLINLDDLPHNNSFSVKTLDGVKSVHYSDLECDYLISVIPPKTGNIFPVTMSIPNLAGFVKPEERPNMFGVSLGEFKKVNFMKNDRYCDVIDLAGRNFSRLLTRIYPSLVLIDGLYGMEGRGPVKGSPVFHGFSVASEDPVLADSLTTYIMGFDVNDISYLHYSFQERLGHNRWQNVIGVDPPQVKFPYRPHPLFPKQKKWREQLQQRKPNEEHTRKKD